MPQFAYPWLLMLLPIAPLAAAAWLRKHPAAIRWPDIRPFSGLPNGRTLLARVGGATLRGLAVGAIILALAGPRWPDEGSRLPTDGIAIAVALDVSGSMAEPDFDWDDEKITRLSAAQRALRQFVLGDESIASNRGQDQISLTAFAALPEDTCPLTLSHDVLLQFLDAEKPRSLPETGTNVGDAIAWSLRTLQASDSQRKILVLVSDGEHNSPGPALTPRQSAQLAAQQGVAVYTIDAGPRLNDAAKPEDRAERESGHKALAAVAAMTGGKSFAAHDAATMRAALTEIDRLERSPIQSFQYRRFVEGFPEFAIAAALCLTLVFGLESTIWRRTP